MKNLTSLLILASFTSCNNSTDKKEKVPDEFNFQHLRTIQNPNQSYAYAFEESDTVNIGDTYRVKVFLANRSNVYDGDSIEPQFRFYHKKYKNWDELTNQDALVESINDTVYVKFLVQDNELKKGQTKDKKWFASIIIPLQQGDTIFSIEQVYTVQRK